MIIFPYIYVKYYSKLSFFERKWRVMQKYTAVLDFPQIAGISIATRPDCLPPEVLQLFQDLKQRYPDKFIWVELGLQTIHEKTASFIRRGYLLSCFEDAVTALHRLQIPVITHVILGLPGETASMQLQTNSYLALEKSYKAQRSAGDSSQRFYEEIVFLREPLSCRSFQPRYTKMGRAGRGLHHT